MDTRMEEETRKAAKGRAKPRRFTREFKRSAVRLVIDEKRSVAQTARDLWLWESVLHGWVRQVRIDQGTTETSCGAKAPSA